MTGLSQLTKRQQAVLRAIIHEYIKSAMPVSSQAIADKYHLRVSSATIRNEMAKLEKGGYLMHPHTSAGRVPTEEGYRYFVKKLMEQVDLSRAEKRTINHQFHQARLELDQWLRLSAAVLAHVSHNAAVVTAPRSTLCRVKHIELILIQGQIVLLVLVLEGGTVKQQILSLGQVLTQDELGPVGRRLTATWSGLNVNEILATISTLTHPVAIQVGEVTVETMRRIDTRRSSDVYRDGLLNMLAQPEFSRREGFERIVRAIEERTVIEQLVTEALQQGGVQIIIGGEGKWEELSEVSIVLARYGVGDEITGAMGVLGPLRMPYNRTVSVVRYMSKLMSNLISDLYGHSY